MFFVVILFCQIAVYKISRDSKVTYSTRAEEGGGFVVKLKKLQKEFKLMYCWELL